MHLHKAAFFDRDGTLIKDVPYLSHLEDIEVLPGAVRIAQQCMHEGYTLFVVTNQSGVARGIYDEAFVQVAHQRVADLFGAHGVVFEKFYFCPHHPTHAKVERYHKVCDCRKPKPGLLLTAAREYDLDLSQSILFGNDICDFQAGRAAGCAVYDITKLFTSSQGLCGRL
jgi:D-glycero-D-manno-heptose 1,7-bisphosphate phosphatase